MVVELKQRFKHQNIKVLSRKIILQSSVLKNPKILEEISEMFGSQSITVSLEFYKRNTVTKLLGEDF